MIRLNVLIAVMTCCLGLILPEKIGFLFVLDLGYAF